MSNKQQLRGQPQSNIVARINMLKSIIKEDKERIKTLSEQRREKGFLFNVLPILKFSRMRLESARKEKDSLTHKLNIYTH